MEAEETMETCPRGENRELVPNIALGSRAGDRKLSTTPSIINVHPEGV